MSGSLRAIRIPRLGRIAYLPPEEQALTAGALFDTRLYALHRDSHGHEINDRTRPEEFIPGKGYDMGSGLVTNVGVFAMAQDPFWSASLNLATLTLANQHAWGTGATAAAVTDIQMQTLAAPTTTAAVAGAQTFLTGATAAVPKYQTVATITAGGTLAITEWGLHSSGTLTATTGTPLTAATATVATATATPLTASTASIRGQQQTIIKTATTTVWGLVLSNTTAAMTLASNGTTGWWTVAASTAGATPGATEAYTLLPVMWDRKVFAAINVVLNDTCQFSYQLQINSGG